MRHAQRSTRMKFLCIDCDAQMTFEERQQPGDGTFAASFACPRCGRRVAMLANPMETQLVSTLGVEIGGRTLDEQPLEFTRGALEGRDDAFTDHPAPRGPRPAWSPDAQERLHSATGFVRGHEQKNYIGYTRERSLSGITSREV